MPLLGGLLLNLFSGLVGWLSQYVTRKVAFAVAYVTAYSTLTAALFVLMRVTLANVASTVPALPTMFVQGMALAVPPVAPFCLSTYVTMWTACTVYTWQRDLLSLAAKA